VTGPSTPEEYLAALQPAQREAAEAVRAAIRLARPDAEEKVRYGIVAFMLGGRYALHYAAWAKHIGLYPVPHDLPAELEAELAPFRAEKDSLKLLYRDPLPLDLITRTAAAIAELRR